MTSYMDEKPSVKRTWRSVIWDNDADLKSPEERRLVFKIDCTILIYACLGEFLKLLDQGNLSNAYISGMKEEINLTGNTYNTASSMFSVGYAIGIIPATLLLTKFRPSIILPIAELFWGTATLATCAVKTPAHLAACRFFVGLSEAPFYTGLVVILGTWYTPAEQGKRQSILFVMAQVGNLFSGYLQASVYHLGGVSGMSGWRWLYVIDGCMTIPIALLGFLVFPDTPAAARSFLFDASERALATTRVQAARIAQPTGHFIRWNVIKKALMNKYYWLFVLGYILYGLSTQASSTWFGVWLKSENYSVSLRNIIPTCTNVVTIVSVLTFGWISDIYRTRPKVIVAAITYSLFPQICLSVWNIPNGLKFFSYLTLGVEFITALFFSWAAESMRDDFAVKAFTLASMNALQYAMSAWVSILQFPASQSPKFAFAYQLCAIFGGSCIGIIGIICWLQRREEGKRETIEEEIIETSEKGEKEEK
ncbi:MFS general substrate transporter [Stereum hirsutum FP-91666 SS1]|uniref:MFS general substrate transporter n=1 Tax=Stereum hirsutum (strain FP-91666) TaxID=721885 RepID=UPI000444A5E2|nr:MFS general substrate transporter [Stereum hirsutum FP-91666 SS1]EIM83716.1 MFS general substrate transporter [Stereum hirsutum FP-91666 SS1]